MPTHSDQEVAQYINYTFVEGDSLKNVLRRLRLFPIWGSQGSYYHFLKLNPSWPKEERAGNPAPVGSRVVLPIDKAPLPKSKSSDQWVVKFGELYFINPKRIDKTDLYTRILNLKQLQGKATTKIVTKSQVRQPANTQTQNLSEYEFGRPVIKVPVKPGSALAQRLGLLGLVVPPLEKGKPYAYVEIPMLKWNEVVNGRQPSALSEIRMKDPSKARYRLNAQVVTASRLYSISDSNGETGEIGIDPGFGAEIGFSYKQSSWLNLQAKANYQLETFQSDDAILIEQETESRLDANIVNYFSFWGLEMGAGFGILSTPSFVSVSTTNIQAKHLNNTYVTLNFRDSFSMSNSWMAGWNFSYDQLLGVEDGPYKLESGYRVTGGGHSHFRLTPSMNLSSQLNVSYQNDKPATYDQTQLGFQILMGLEWSFGNTEAQ